MESVLPIFPVAPAAALPQSIMHPPCMTSKVARHGVLHNKRVTLSALDMPSFVVAQKYSFFVLLVHSTFRLQTSQRFFRLFILCWGLRKGFLSHGCNFGSQSLYCFPVSYCFLKLFCSDVWFLLSISQKIFSLSGIFLCLLYLGLTLTVPFSFHFLMMFLTVEWRVFCSLYLVGGSESLLVHGYKLQKISYPSPTVKKDRVTWN